MHLWNGVPPNVQVIVCYLYLKKPLGYTALMEWCATQCTVYCLLALPKEKTGLHCTYGTVCHLMYSLLFVTCTLRKHWVTLHLWDGVPPEVQFMFVNCTLRKDWVTLHLWDGVPPNVQFIVC